jgi:hypothetical protein
MRISRGVAPSKPLLHARLTLKKPSKDPQKPLFLAVFAHGRTSWRYRNTVVFARFELVLTSKTHHWRSFGARKHIIGARLALENTSRGHKS